MLFRSVTMIYSHPSKRTTSSVMALRAAPPSPESAASLPGEGCYVVPLCQGVQQIFSIELTLDDQKEHQAKQTPAVATLLYVDWDNQRKSDTDRSMVRRER